MKPSNNPDIALAQEWLQQLDAWMDIHGLCGPDPFDVKQHPLIRVAQPHFLPRKAATLLCDLFPRLTRRAFRIAPTENPKTHALLALARLRLFELTGDSAWRDRALEHIAWLVDHSEKGYAGLCWGYPFDVFAKGLDTPAGTPNVVVSSLAGQAFLRAHRLTGEAVHLDRARSVAEFILRDLPRMAQDDGSYCFGYTPTDRRRVHNANLLASELFFRIWALTQEDGLIKAAEPALRFTLDRQREDGAWYYGEHEPGDPYEAATIRIVDNYHTGFVLRSLHGIQKVRPEEAVKKALKRGYRFYLKLFTPLGMPLNEYGKYPVDIHACAEAVLCPSVLNESLARTRPLATLSLRWAHFCLRDPRSGAPYYRKYPWFVSRIVFPRWGVAWMYYALAEYLYRFCSEETATISVSEETGSPGGASGEKS